MSTWKCECECAQGLVPQFPGLYNLKIPKSKPIKYAQISSLLNNLGATKAMVRMIKEVRDIARYPLHLLMEACSRSSWQPILIGEKEITSREIKILSSFQCSG